MSAQLSGYQQGQTKTTASYQGLPPRSAGEREKRRVPLLQRRMGFLSSKATLLLPPDLPDRR